jgi:hypothetical protein
MNRGAARSDHVPPTAELRDRLAQDLSGAPIADVVGERVPRLSDVRTVPLTYALLQLIGAVTRTSLVSVRFRRDTERGPRR